MEEKEIPEEIPAEDDPLAAAISSLPPTAGVYLMKDSKGVVIYVGKAVNLRSRVRSYFRDSGDGRLNAKFLRGRVANVETIVTATEKESLLLENLLIKKHQPRYNIRLRDDKTYLSLRLDLSHEWPRVHPIRRRLPGDKAVYFGPFSSSSAMKETLRFLQRLFPLRSCPDHVLNNRSRPCILHQIDRCCAPCVGLVDKEKYDEYVDQTTLFLNGRKEEVLQLLKEKMWEYSESLSFEKAAAVRDKIRAIERTVEKEHVAGQRRFDRDVVALAREAGHAVFLTLCFRGGNLDDTRTDGMRDHGLPDAEMMEGFLGQRYGEGTTIPRDIITSIEPSHLDLLRASLADIRGGAVRILCPRRGEKLRLVEMARNNAQQELQRRMAGERSREAVLASLRDRLRLDRLPRHIECFDISTFQGAFTVGSMTCFIDGDPDKSRYRRFKVRTVGGQDDFASMREVLTRRYKRLVDEGGDTPDLVVIDGGKGQLNIAIEVFRELGLLGRSPLCGLAKARLLASKQGPRTAVRSEERVFLPLRKDAVRFDQSDPALFILTRLRDEAHRFGITYHRKLRAGAALKSGLEEIPGVGPKRRKALLTHFGSLARIRAATEEELTAAPGITPDIAHTIHQFLHGAGEVEPETGEDAEDLFAAGDDQEPDDLV